MLPGVVVPPTGLPQVQQGDLCAIALVGNRYCVRQLPFVHGVCVVTRGTGEVEESDHFQSTRAKN